VRYTVASRGRPIGHTELAFTPIGGPSRSGWLHPNEEGERVLPSVASPLPAMRAFLHRDVRDADGRPIVRQELLKSTLFADLAEALHRVEALELTLHDERGALIPTSLIGIQDTKQLIELSEESDAPFDETEEWENAPLMDEMEDSDLPWFDEVDLEEAVARDLADAEDRWAFQAIVDSLPRYQIHVVPLEGSVVP
jgi:hypothetical protein